MNDEELVLWAENLLNNPSFDINKIVDTKKQNISNIIFNLEKIKIKFPELTQNLEYISVKTFPSLDFDNFVDGEVSIDIFCQDDKVAQKLLFSDTVIHKLFIPSQHSMYGVSHGSTIKARIINGWHIPNKYQHRYTLKKSKFSHYQFSNACKLYLKMNPGCRKLNVVGPEIEVEMPVKSVKCS